MVAMHLGRAVFQSQTTDPLNAAVDHSNVNTVTVQALRRFAGNARLDATVRHINATQEIRQLPGNIAPEGSSLVYPTPLVVTMVAVHHPNAGQNSLGQ